MNSVNTFPSYFFNAQFISFSDLRPGLQIYLFLYIFLPIVRICSVLLHACYMSHPFYTRTSISLYDHYSNTIIHGVHILKLSIIHISPTSSCFLFDPNSLCSTLLLNILNLCSSLYVRLCYKYLPISTVLIFNLLNGQKRLLF